MPAKVKAEAAQLVMEIPDIREFIMINLEPQSMFNLIFASPAALRTYNMDPQIYLNAAVHELPEYLRAWAKALLQVTKGGPCGGTEVHCNNPGFCWVHIDMSLGLQDPFFRSLQNFATL